MNAKLEGEAALIHKEKKAAKTEPVKKKAVGMICNVDGLFLGGGAILNKGDAVPDDTDKDVIDVLKERGDIS